MRIQNMVVVVIVFVKGNAFIRKQEENPFEQIWLKPLAHPGACLSAAIGLSRLLPLAETLIWTSSNSPLVYNPSL